MPENSDKFRDALIMRGLMFSLTWQDIMATLDHCCTPNEKEPILRKAREHTDGLLTTNPHQIHQAGGDAIPEHDPHWNHEDCVVQAWMRFYITCLSEGMKTCMVKLVNYDKVREVKRWEYHST